MKKLKLILTIVGVVGIAFWLVCCFQGLFFASNGNLMVAIPVTLLFGVAMFLFYFLLLKSQDKIATQGNAKEARRMGYVWLGLYMVTVLCSAFYFNHLVSTYENREYIKEQARKGINELKVTFSPDGAPGSYREWVAEELGRYERHMLAEGYQGDTAVLWAEFEDNLINEDYENLESKVNASLGQIKASVVDNWYLPTLLQRLKELGQKEEWEKQVVNISKSHEYTQDDPFCPKSEVDVTDCTDKLTHATFSFSRTAIIIMIVLQFVILLAYLLFIKWRFGKIITPEADVWPGPENKKKE